MKDAAILARFSDRPRTRNGRPVVIEPSETIERQVERCKLYCEWAQPQLRPRWILEEPFVSAHELPLAERPKGAELLALIEAGCRHVVVQKLDRLSRNVPDGMAILDRWTEQGVTLHCADERGIALRTDTSAGYMVAGMMLLFSHTEAMRIGERTSESMQRHQYKGHRVMTHRTRLPYGQMIDPADPAKTIPCPSELETLEAIRSLLATYGNKPRIIGRELNRLRLLARNGQEWHPGTLARILNRVCLAREALRRS